MLHSISFVIDGMVATQVRVTGNLDGTLSFEVTRLDARGIGDLEAVFLDLNRSLDGDGFRVYGDTGFTVGACVVEGADTLGRRATIRQAVVDPLGDFDIAVAFGSLAPGLGAARTTGFTLGHDTAALTLDMIDLCDFGLRYAAPAAPHIDVRASEESEGRAHAASQVDALAVIEIQAVRARPLADDIDGGVLVVIDLLRARSLAAIAEGSGRSHDDWVTPSRAGLGEPALSDRGAEHAGQDADVRVFSCPWPVVTPDDLLPPQ